MKKENSEELVRLAPNFFSLDEEKPSPYSQRGIEAGDGWFELLRDMVTVAESELTSLPEKVRSKIRCSQIKEKFGGLRVYMDGPAHANLPMFGAAADAAEARAWKTCETCGAVGERRNLRGWAFVACNLHFAEAKKRR